MPASIVVLSILLAVAFTAAALSKLTGLPGFAVTAIGAVAAIGLTLLMIAAVSTHRRAGDPPAQMATAAVLGIISAVTAGLYLAHYRPRSGN